MLKVEPDFAIDILGGGPEQLGLLLEGWKEENSAVLGARPLSVRRSTSKVVAELLVDGPYPPMSVDNFLFGE